MRQKENRFSMNQNPIRLPRLFLWLVVPLIRPMRKTTGFAVLKGREPEHRVARSPPLPSISANEAPVFYQQTRPYAASGFKPVFETGERIPGGFRDRRSHADDLRYKISGGGFPPPHAIPLGGGIDSRRTSKDPGPEDPALI
jgi:hypothetical protein